MCNCYQVLEGNCSRPYDAVKVNNVVHMGVITIAIKYGICVVYNVLDEKISTHSGNNAWPPSLAPNATHYAPSNQIWFCFVLVVFVAFNFRSARCGYQNCGVELPLYIASILRNLTQLSCKPIDLYLIHTDSIVGLRCMNICYWVFLFWNILIRTVCVSRGVKWVTPPPAPSERESERDRQNTHRHTHTYHKHTQILRKKHAHLKHIEIQHTRTDLFKSVIWSQ